MTERCRWTSWTLGLGLAVACSKDPPLDSSGGTGGMAVAGGAACLEGTLRCPCFRNQTCDQGLTCVSEVCVMLGGVAGSATGGSANGLGGAASLGGSDTGGVATASGGVSTGGTPVSTSGGTSSTGGTASSLTDNPVNLLFSFSTGTNGIAGSTSSPAVDDITASTTLTRDPTVNAPCKVDLDNAGSLKIVAPFTSYDQRVDLQFNLSGPFDYANRTLYLWLRYDDGFNPDASSPGGIVFSAKSGADWIWGQAEWSNIEPANKGNWTLVSFDLANPDLVNSSGFDPSQLVSIGLVFHTGSNAAGVSSSPTTATFHVDCIGWTLNG